MGAHAALCWYALQRGGMAEGFDGVGNGDEGEGWHEESAQALLWAASLALACFGKREKAALSQRITCKVEWGLK